jgi:phosphoglycolate phosphatase-like HAD superfamily hydrolase
VVTQLPSRIISIDRNIIQAKNCILALDFDGTVWDTVGESYIIAKRAWEKLRGPLPRDLEKPFRQARWLARATPDFLLMFEIMTTNAEIDWQIFSREEFMQRRNQLSHQTAQDFDKAFYHEREKLRSSEFDLWIQLQQPYVSIVDEIPRLQQQFKEVVITSTKDEESARQLLNTANIKLEILGKNFSRDKQVQLAHLSKTKDVLGNQIILVDDLRENLESVRASGALLALATWGYNTPSEQKQAAADKIHLVKQERLGQQLDALFMSK